jgi:transcriptional regulator with PAS, ATPase and Fis domain
VKTLIDLREKRIEKHSRKQLNSLYNFRHIIGEDDRMLEILETIGRVAATDAPV